MRMQSHPNESKLLIKSRTNRNLTNWPVSGLLMMLRDQLVRYQQHVFCRVHGKPGQGSRDPLGVICWFPAWGIMTYR